MNGWYVATVAQVCVMVEVKSFAAAQSSQTKPFTQQLWNSQGRLFFDICREKSSA